MEIGGLRMAKARRRSQCIVPRSTVQARDFLFRPGVLREVFFRGRTVLEIIFCKTNPSRLAIGF
jgi:hypothetical protein